MNKFHIITAVVFVLVGIYVGARYNVPYIGKSAG